jgi:transcriptional regulator with XRE-family HTH domain
MKSLYDYDIISIRYFSSMKMGADIMSIDKTAKNIRSLRMAYGETLMELAYALGLNSPSAISNYEKGIRQPERDLLRKIASHYLITVDELVHSDFSKFNVISFPFDDKEKMKKVFATMFPIICTDDALDDPLFKKGYEAHMCIYKDIEAENESSDKDFDISIDAYIESYETNHTLESAANSLWYIFLSGMILKNPRMFDGAKKLKKQQIRKADFLKNFYLRNTDDDYIEEDEVEQKDELQEFLEVSEEEIIKMLRGLKASPKWSDIADYYMAFRYFLCIVNNELSDDMNRAVGGEMMWAIAELGNTYAKKFLRASIEASKK